MTNFEADQSANSKLFSFYQKALAFCNILATVLTQRRLILREMTNSHKSNSASNGATTLSIMTLSRQSADTQQTLSRH